MENVLPIEIAQVDSLSAADFIDILERSGLAERRPVADVDRIGRMLRQANILVVARDTQDGRIVGVARSLTDFAYCCYLSDLAVDRACQKQGIGKRLIEATREIAGPEAMCLLVSAPDSVGFYEGIAMPRQERAFMFPRER